MDVDSDTLESVDSTELNQEIIPQTGPDSIWFWVGLAACSLWMLYALTILLEILL